MQAKKRYAWLVVCVCILLVYIFVFGPSSGSETRDRLSDDFVLLLDNAPSFMDYKTDVALDRDLFRTKSHAPTSPCTMSSCFNFSRCSGRFLVHIYPDPTQSPLPPVSAAYNKILSSIRHSKYYTAQASEACLFVLSYDTLDRDRLSGDYVKNMQSKLDLLDGDLWDQGRNHLIFNMYHGSWPDYDLTDLNFDPGMALMARASTSTRFYRDRFDIALPLFHKELPLRAVGAEQSKMRLNFPTKDGYLLVFKGKRYVYGIGSETRNSLYHLHNGKDVIMLTTCKHGKAWKQLQDERCAEDNEQYERWDYTSLMRNSTFCLVPRGRRLGSFRFLESLKQGCIPVVLSDNWELPFDQVIDWTVAVLRVDERLLLQVPELLRLIPQSRILQMKQQGRRLFEMYFSSVEKIVHTALEIIHSRLTMSVDSRVWQSGVHNYVPSYSGDLTDYPFFVSSQSQPHFTAIIYAGTPFIDTPAQPAPLLKLIANVAKSAFCRKILLLWGNDRSIPKLSRWPASKVLLQIVDVRQRGLSARLIPYREIQTPAVFSIDDRVLLSTDEVDFAMQVWRWFPARLVGYYSRTHVWDNGRKGWRYSSKHLDKYSLVLLDAAIYHRYYHYLYDSSTSPSISRVLEQAPECQDLYLNLLITDLTNKAPISLSPKSPLKVLPNQFKTRQMCWEAFESLLGPINLKFSSVRMDPVLWKDAVSNLKKKYRQMEN